MKLAPKKTPKKKVSTIHIAISIALYAILALFICALLLISANYQKIYKSPNVEDGIVDFEGTNLLSRKVESILSGEWEFFYNRWIVTDNEPDAQPDGLLSVPGHWTQKNFSGKKFPKSGYASYRLTAYNVPEGLNISVVRTKYAGAYRIFINGELTSCSGTMSKEVSGTKVSGKVDKRITHLSDGNPIEIVIELSATNGGGLTAAPWLSHYYDGGIDYGRSLRNFSSVSLGFTTMAVLITICIFIFFGYKRDITMPILMAILYVHFLLSKDMIYYSNIPYDTAIIVEVISAVAAFIALLWHLHKAGAKFDKKLNIVCAAISVIMAVVFIVLHGTDYSGIPAYGIIAVACAYIYPIIASTKIPPALRGVYGALSIFILSIFSFELADILGLIVYGTEFIFSFEIMLVIVCFALLWFFVIASASKEALRVGMLENELARIKQQALKSQIKPHFVFNSLTAIQSLYHSSLRDGDEALEHFARHLRLNIDSDGADIIPFDAEVRNILNYFELENLRAGGALTLLLDINYTDFSVPVLSLQPLVENAISHSGIDKIKDGYIMLGSSFENGVVTVKVSDNGKGFDVQNLGVGLTNTRERFALMGAKMSIASSSSGTEITITITKEEA